MSTRTAGTDFERITSCRSCGNPELAPLLELGEVPLANALLSREQISAPEAHYPLTLVFCPRCSLVQIVETVDPSVLFREYFYLSSFSDAMLAHAKEHAERLTTRFRLGPESLVVEVASNDGYLLKNFVATGVPVLGIEPATNIAKVAREEGVDTLCEFFGAEIAQTLRSQGRRADIILANNVLAHVADLNSVVEGMALLLADDGRAVIEAPYVGTMIDQLEFDTIYHEHLCYFSLTALCDVFARHGLRIFDVEQIDIHGGSLRIFAQPESTAPEPSDAVRGLLADERERGMTELGFYREFSNRVEALRDDLRRALGELRDAGKTVAAYGASAKGSTLMNYCGVGGDDLAYIADRSTVKQGHWSPGNHLEIVDPKVLVERMPDAVLLLTWNFASEIFRQQAEYLRKGGRFLVPVPEVRFVGEEVLG